MLEGTLLRGFLEIDYLSFVNVSIYRHFLSSSKPLPVFTLSSKFHILVEIPHLLPSFLPFSLLLWIKLLKFFSSGLSREKINASVQSTVLNRTFVGFLECFLFFWFHFFPSLEILHLVICVTDSSKPSTCFIFKSPTVSSLLRSSYSLCAVRFLQHFERGNSLPCSPNSYLVVCGQLNCFSRM